MLLIRQRAHARAGLLGNPSDGFHGRTLSCLVRNYWAEVILYEWDQIEILPSVADQTRFRNVNELARDVRLHGYYGGVRLIKATIKRFAEYCDTKSIQLHDGCFSVRYESNIPRNVGLAGSSAIIVATLRALQKFYDVTIPREILPSLALAVEREELGIPGGLQDRVIQVYGSVVYMDFTLPCTHRVDGMERGEYEPLDPSLLPPLYVAFSEDFGEPTEVLHSHLRERYAEGEPAVVDAMRTFAELAREGREALVQRDWDRFGRLMDLNFDTRRSICRLHPDHVTMVEAARQTGASAKFAGSGGAIVGTYRDDAMFQQLVSTLAPLRCRVIKPMVGE